MASNHKLTGVIAGKTVQTLSVDGGKLTIAFEDGTAMTVKLGAVLPDATKIGVIQAVRQSGVALSLDYEDGSTLDIETQEETSNVMVRDENHKMTYAD